MTESLWEGGPRLELAEGVFPISADSLLLADFARPGPRDRLLDLGAGSGLLPLLLLYEYPERTAAALELDENACALAERNLRENGLSHRAAVVHGDLRQYRALLSPGSFDFALSNPPYYSAGSGSPAGRGLEHARGDGTCPLGALCQSAAWALRWGGRFALVFRPERLCGLMAALRSAGLEPKRLRPVHHDRTAPVNLILLEARKGGRPGLLWENDVYLYGPDGAETEAFRRVCRRS